MKILFPELLSLPSQTFPPVLKSSGACRQVRNPPHPELPGLFRDYDPRTGQPSSAAPPIVSRAMRFLRSCVLPAASLGMAALALVASGPPAIASGLVGAFSPQFWTLNRYVYDGFSYVLQDSLGYANDDYVCGNAAGDPACVAINAPGSVSSPATFVVKGSTFLDPAPLSPNDVINAEEASTIIEWSLVYNDPAPVTTTFNFLFSSADVSNAIQGYFVVRPGAYEFNPQSPDVELLASGSSNLFAQTFTVTQGDTVRFGIYTQANTAGKLGSLTIDSFNITEPVPAPLPLLGAGAAFSWSRRLRRRIKVVDVSADY
jgi:hypothetical protein